MFSQFSNSVNRLVFFKHGSLFVKSVFVFFLFLMFRIDVTQQIYGMWDFRWLPWHRVSEILGSFYGRWGSRLKARTRERKKFQCNIKYILPGTRSTWENKPLTTWIWEIQTSSKFKASNQSKRARSPLKQTEIKEAYAEKIYRTPKSSDTTDTKHRRQRRNCTYWSTAAAPSRKPTYRRPHKRRRRMETQEQTGVRLRLRASPSPPSPSPSESEDKTF